MKKKHQCVDTHLLCASTYISESEAFCQYTNYDANEDKLRLCKIFDNPDQINHLQKLNEYSQYQDFGGWNTKPDGSPAVQKIHKGSEGDFYICPYCSAQLFPAEVERSQGYRYDCCHKGTMRSLIEVEKERANSPFAR